MMFDRSSVRPVRSSRSARAPQDLPTSGEAAAPRGKAALPRIPIEALAVESPGHPPAQRRARLNRTGLPDRLKSGIESLSGVSLDAVRVYRNSPHPQRLGAHAYARGGEIHVAPGQERHLPHEAWHLVQQAQGRVRPTLHDRPGLPINDDAGLEREADAMGARALAASAAPAARPRPALPPAAAAAPLAPPAAQTPAQLVIFGPAGMVVNRIQAGIRRAGNQAQRRGYMSQAQWDELPAPTRASIEARPMTPQFPRLCHTRVDEHLRAAPQDAKPADKAPPAPTGLLAQVGGFLSRLWGPRPPTETDDIAKAKEMMNAGKPLGLRATNIADKDSVYRGFGHSVTVHGKVGDHAVIQDGDHTHDSHTKAAVEGLADKHGVAPHDLTAEQLKEIGGQRLFTRLVPEEEVIGSTHDKTDKGVRLPRFRYAEDPKKGEKE